LTKKRLIFYTQLYLGTTKTKYSIIKDLQISTKQCLSLRLKAGNPSRFTAFKLKQLPTIKKMVEVNGIEPMTSCVQGRRSPS
jgi:hypothetical protein